MSFFGDVWDACKKIEHYSEELAHATGPIAVGVVVTVYTGGNVQAGMAAYQGAKIFDEEIAQKFDGKLQWIEDEVNGKEDKSSAASGGQQSGSASGCGNSNSSTPLSKELQKEMAELDIAMFYPNAPDFQDKVGELLAKMKHTISHIDGQCGDGVLHSAQDRLGQLEQILDHQQRVGHHSSTQDNCHQHGCHSDPMSSVRHQLADLKHLISGQLDHSHGFYGNITHILDGLKGTLVHDASKDAAPVGWYPADNHPVSSRSHPVGGGSDRPPMQEP
jgi:hypothetical protein